ncbi:hypothetical protein PXD04_09175 [Methanosphaera sp. ISO3-F5]|nr:hypothetical protein [Methanosphaera sp. ISO3-F5]WQH63860.1 hypothetical protein PXD04_09175 [Methanosphaera sp. ISO3-F5]
MRYMNKEITYKNNQNQTQYTYITPNNIFTTKKNITKRINHKINI